MRKIFFTLLIASFVLWAPPGITEEPHEWPIPGLPTYDCIDIEKQVSVDGGRTWFDADTEQEAWDNELFATNGAEYRLIITNSCEAWWGDVTISDPNLGGFVTLFPGVNGFPENSSLTFTKADEDFDWLDQPDRCDPFEPVKVNTATVTARHFSSDYPYIEAEPASDSAYVLCEEPPLACRVTGGGNDFIGDVWDGSMAWGQFKNQKHVDSYTFGGQGGAPTASQPQPFGEWTHHQQRGPQGTFVFHAGTASAPPGTEISLIECSDPGGCSPSGDPPSPAKQIDFEGIGTFKNIKKTGGSFTGSETTGETFHWFSVHIEDLGEPGKGGKVEPPGDTCPESGADGLNGIFADCACPDFYAITIHATSDPSSDVIYHVHGYIKGGNLQIHHPIK